ncbi:MAG TPA: hypothetical protein VFW22_14255 [Pseudolabrys sp.]|nr:hypothetical protein [Pseudolabrys sp.]
MLVARRDPFHPGAHDAPFAHDGPGGTPRLARTVGLLQVVGSLLAIPVGLASAYSIYRANFSAETSCQSLRADIISMIDKRLDAGTRRILVGRDVEKFEQTCGAIDPAATAAFKTLLTTDKSPAVAAHAVPAPAPVAAPPAKVAQPPVKQAVRKAEAHPQEVDKMPAAAWPGSERHEPGVSDSQWLDAVRQALVTHEASRAPAEARVAPAAPPVLRADVRETAVAIPAPAPAATPVVAPAVAPTLPPPAAVAAPVAPAAPLKAESDHPVPPGVIPDPVEAASADANDHRSRVRRWIAKIPLMGNVIDNGLQ